MTLQIYDFMLLPDVTFYFQKDMFPENKITPEQEGEDILFLLKKKPEYQVDVKQEDFYPYGVMGMVDRVDKEGTIRITVKEKIKISDVSIAEDGTLDVSASICPETEDIDKEEEMKLFEKIRKDILAFVQEFQWGIWARGYILRWNNMNEMVCALSGYMNLRWEEKYEVLETSSRRRRCEWIEHAVYELLETLRVGEEAEYEQKETQERLYREHALKKQIEILQRELDDMHPESISDVRMLERKIQESGMNPEARKEAEKVLNRMKQEGKEGHEYGILYDYLDFVTGLSWKKEAMPEICLDEAQEILDADHYGLKKVKERIIQQIAVMALNQKQSGSILLFVGAPGTGKTSIGQSIARALKRPYVRVSLGGIRDEAEIRGHRRTYVGAMPGRIMEGIRRSGGSNPVMVLDEVDKLAKDYSGDPASALLEVLDPEQNASFTDHYMNVPYDLSDVCFICTANTLDTIPEPLLNRMEVIPFSGYTPVEKFWICKKHLLPKAMKHMGIKVQNLKVSDEALRRIIEEYTAESGVRGLKKQMDILCRNIAVKLVRGEQKSISVSEKRVPELLGRREHRHDKMMQEGMCGVVTGLAWTSAGGEILFVETLFTKGSGKVILTGQLGDVMKESAQIAVTIAKAMYPEMAKKFETHDLHIHVPEGAIPKDGPSAGITLVTALCSLLTQKTVSPQIAMTGEVSLREVVLPIGGLAEKLMAAQRAGIRTVYIPWENAEDLEDVAQEVKDALEIVPVKNVKDVLARVLE